MASKSQQRPFSIKVFMPDGDPDGLKIVSRSNWAGVGVVFNRSNYKEAAQREEFRKTGVYVLIGSSEESSLPTIYVGEGDPVKDRLNHHYVKKEFWDWAVFFASNDDSLNKAHVQHLESRMIALAKSAKQCILDNTQEPLAPTLSDADRADMESFLLDMLSIFPLLGLAVFEKTETTKKAAERLKIKAKGIIAFGYEDAKGFVVEKASQLVREEAPSIPRFMSIRRKDLLGQRVIVEEGEHYVFTQDQVFKSPTMAAGVVLGSSANGRIEWKNLAGKTLKDLQTAAAESEDGARVVDHK
jgi:hypothetical protein